MQRPRDGNVSGVLKEQQGGQQGQSRMSKGGQCWPGVREETGAIVRTWASSLSEGNLESLEQRSEVTRYPKDLWLC